MTIYKDSYILNKVKSETILLGQKCQVIDKDVSRTGMKKLELHNYELSRRLDKGVRKFTKKTLLISGSQPVG